MVAAKGNPAAAAGPIVAADGNPAAAAGPIVAANGNPVVAAGPIVETALTKWTRGRDSTGK